MGTSLQSGNMRQDGRVKPEQTKDIGDSVWMESRTLREFGARS